MLSESSQGRFPKILLSGACLIGCSLKDQDSTTFDSVQKRSYWVEMEERLKSTDRFYAFAELVDYCEIDKADQLLQIFESSSDPQLRTQIFDRLSDFQKYEFVSLLIGKVSSEKDLARALTEISREGVVEWKIRLKDLGYDPLQLNFRIRARLAEMRSFDTVEMKDTCWAHFVDTHRAEISKDWLSTFLLAELYFIARKWSEAEELYERAIALIKIQMEQDSQWPHQNWSEQGQKFLAPKMPVRSFGAYLWAAQDGLGVSLAELKEVKRSARILQDALKTAKEFVWRHELGRAHYNLAASFALLKLNDECLEHLAEAFHLEPKYRSQIHYDSDFKSIDKAAIEDLLFGNRKWNDRLIGIERTTQ